MSDNNAQKVDVRILCTILEVQNKLYHLSSGEKIAKYCAKSLSSIPGVRACRVCLENNSSQKGDINVNPCKECDNFRQNDRGTASVPKEMKCKLGTIQGSCILPIETKENLYGYIIFIVDKKEFFGIYKLFIENLVHVVAISLETLLLNRSLQKEHNELEEKEKRYKLLISSVTDYIYNVDVHKDCSIVINHGPGCVSITGYSPEDYSADPDLWYRMVPEEDRNTVMKQVDHVLSGIPVQPMEHRIIHRDGSVRWVKHTHLPCYDAEGELLTYDGLIQDITDRKRAEEALSESEIKVRRKLDAVLSPGTDIGELELTDIIDSEKIQKMMDEFYRITKVGIGIIDLKGRVLVGTGWQDICTKFHRVNQESCKLCIESDLELSRNVPAGTFKKYKCKLHMWDIATPIMLGERHMGNIFLGQFLYDDEKPDYETFRRQARRYGFDEDEYIAALNKVPRWSQETVDAVMSFYAAFAGMVGNLSYSNINLTKALENQKQTESTLRHERSLLTRISETSPIGIITTNAEGIILSANYQAEKILGLSKDEINQRTYNAPEWRITDFDGGAFPDEKLPFRQVKSGGIPVYNIRHAIEWPDGRRVYLSINGAPLFDEAGNIERTVFSIEDITKQKEAEKERRTHVEFLENMDKVNRAIQGTSDPERMMNDVLDVVLSIFSCDRAFLMYPCDPESPTWNVPMERSRPEYPGVLELGLEMPMDGDVAESLRILLAAEGPVQFGPGTSYPLPEEVSEQFGFKCFMSMAIYPKIGSPWQLGIHQCSHSRLWTDGEILLLKEIGRRLEDGLTGLLSIRNLLQSEERYRLVFENSPVSLWEEDFSDVKALLGGLRNEGVEDIESYLMQHPEIVRRCAEAAKIIDVNRAALVLHGAENKDELLAGLVETFTPESFDTFREELVCLWRGATEMRRDAVVKTLTGELRNVTVCFSVCPGYEETLSRVIVTLIDITERKTAENALRKRNKELERFERAVIGRELKMIYLKKRITELEENNHDMKRDHHEF